MKKTDNIIFQTFNLGLILVVILLTACGSTSAKLRQVSLGMSKEEVIKAIGKPHYVSAQGSMTYFTYNLENQDLGGKSPYFVRFFNGLVDTFGRSGDFGTTSKPKERIEITYPPNK